MTVEEARIEVRRYNGLVTSAYHLDGKLYLLIRHWGGGFYVTHVLNPDSTPLTGGTPGGLKSMELYSPDELIKQGAVCVLHLVQQPSPSLGVSL